MCHFFGVLLNKSLAWIYLIPHEGCEDVVSLDGVFNGHLQQRAPCWIHSSFHELRGIHLAETLVTLNIEILGTRSVHRLQQLWKITGYMFDLAVTQDIRRCA